MTSNIVEDRNNSNSVMVERGPEDVSSSASSLALNKNLDPLLSNGVEANENNKPKKKKKSEKKRPVDEGTRRKQKKRQDEKNQSQKGGEEEGVELSEKNAFSSSDDLYQFVSSGELLSRSVAGDGSVVLNMGDLEEMSITNKATLRWENLNRVIQVDSEEKRKGLLSKQKENRQILYNIRGCVLPGEVAALMGPSGSGKTSLLNCLANRSSGGVTGSITINNEPLNKAMKRKIAYVMQEDIFFDQLTVEQQLLYTSLLRLPRTMTNEMKYQQVKQVVKILGLEKCFKTPINLCSGGEKKRVNIATELLTNPSLIFLDEPTSGLDSTTAASLVVTLRQLSRQGRTIITSIHQPSSQIFQSFDKLILLAAGHQIYYGPPLKTLPYFEAQGLKCPPMYNPADFIMDLVSTDKDITDKVINFFEEKGYKKHYDLPPIAEFDPANPFITEEEKWATSYLTQLQVLTRRNFHNSKSGMFSWLNFFQTISLALICGIIWYKLAPVDIQIFNRSSMIFFAVTFWPMLYLFDGILAYPTERQVLQKERASGSYRLSAYFLSKTISELPVLIVSPTVYLIICYWMVGLNPSAGSFFGYLLFELLSVWTAESIGLIIGASVIDLSAGLVIATVSMIFLLLLAGFFVQNLPAWILKLSYVSLFRYSFNGCLLFEYPDDVVYTCSPVDSPVDLCDTQDTITGIDIRQHLGIQNETIGFNFGLLLLLLVFFRFIAYLCLRYLHTKVER